MTMFEGAELLRLIQKCIQVGTISEVRLEPLRYRVNFDEYRTSAWLFHGVPRAGDDSTWDPLQVGEQVVALFPGGRETGIIICSIYKNSPGQPSEDGDLFMRRFADGTEIIYDKSKHLLKVNIGDSEGEVIVNSATKVTLDTAELLVSGKITATGDIHSDAEISDSTRSMSGDRDIYNSHTHPGDSGGVTGAPNQNQ